MTEAGIPILEELRKQFVELGEEGITVGDVFDKISKRLVPFEMVEKVFKNMTSEGGKFYQMQEVQAETLKGKISNLKDAYDIMFNEIGQKNSGALKGAVDWIRNLAVNYQKTTRVLLELVAALGTYKATMLVIAALGKVVAFGRWEKEISLLTKKIQAAGHSANAFGVAWRKMTSAQQAAAIGTLTGAIALLAVGIGKAIHDAGELRRELNRISEEKSTSAAKSVEDFRNLAERLREATQGSIDYRNAVSALNNKYGEYLPNLLNEANALETIANNEWRIVGAIEAKSRAYAEEEGARKIEEKYGKNIANDAKRIVDELTRRGYGEDEATRFLTAFRQQLLKEDDPLGFEEYFKKFFNTNDAPFINSGYWDALGNYADRLSKETEKMKKEQKDFAKTLDVRFGSFGYSSEADYQATHDIVEKYAQIERHIRSTMKVEEAEVALVENRKAELTELIAKYRQLQEVEPSYEGEGTWQNLINKYQKELDSMATVEQTWLQSLVNGLVEATGKVNNDLRVEAGDSEFEYLDKLRKQYKSVVENLKDAEDTYNGLSDSEEKGNAVTDKTISKAKEQVDLLQQRKTLMEDIAKRLNISLDDGTKKTKSGRASTKTEEQNNLEIERDTLKDIYSWYKKLLDLGLSSAEAGSTLAKIFPGQADIINAGKLEERLLEIADALEKYGLAGKKAAQALRDDLGIGGINAVYNQLKEAKRTKDSLEDFLESWIPQEEANGEGVAFNISKIVKSYEKQVAEAVRKFNEGKKKLDEAKKAGGVSAGKQYNDLEQQLITKRDTDKSRAFSNATEAARKEVEKYYKEWRDGSIDFTNLSDKTIEQIKDMEDEISSFDVSMLDEDTLKDLEAVGVSLEKIKGIFKDLKDADLGKLDTEKTKEQARLWKSVASSLIDATDSVKEFAEAIGDTKLAEAMERVKELGEAVKSIAQGYSQGGVWGAVIAGASSGIEILFKGLTRAAEKQQALLQAAQNYRDVLYDIAQSRAETIFGTDAIKQLQNSFKMANDALQGYKKTLSDEVFTMVIDGGVIQHLAKPLSKILGVSAKDAMKELRSAIANNFSGDEYEAIYRALIDNWETLKDYLDGGEKELLDSLLQYITDFNTAMEDVGKQIQNFFGDIASSMADSMIEAFVQSGDAAYNLGENMKDIFADVGRNIAQTLIESFIIDEVLAKFEQETKDLFEYISGNNTDAEGIAERFSHLAEGIAESADAAATFTNELLQALKSYGIEFGQDSGSNLGDGIKGVTEDTANLLASYINAIRADVSYNKLQLQQILGLLPSSPTIADYLNHIQANTHDSAVAAQGILSRLDSAMAAFPNGGQAFNVNIS